MSTEPPEQIFWHYSEFQPAYNQLTSNPKLHMVHGPPDISELQKNSHVPRLIIIDDLMTSKKNPIEQICTLGTHHWNISCVYIVQNLFYAGLRTSRINATYIVIFKSPADKLQVSTLSKQMYPSEPHKLVDAYTTATSERYTYLLIDLSQECPDSLRLRSNIFPGETTIVYS